MVSSYCQKLTQLETKKSRRAASFFAGIGIRRRQTDRLAKPEN
jgi:hypothetical protein